MARRNHRGWSWLEYERRMLPSGTVLVASLDVPQTSPRPADPPEPGDPPLDPPTTPVGPPGPG